MSVCLSSFLETQVPKLNACTDLMIEKLHHLTCETVQQIPLRDLIQELSLNIITSVSKLKLASK